MSAKWRRNQAWDRAHLTGPLTPVRRLLGAFSSITLAVITLVCIALYAVLASVPVGMLALGVTWAFYIATLLLAASVPGLIAFRLASHASEQSPRAVRATVTLFAGVLATAGGVVLWHRMLWPVLHYDPATGEGVRFFADFVREFGSVTVRRLPAFEMTELEFYSWWPMRLLLIVFVVNMVVATVRRVEFTFKNTGVLTVHTGIVVMALGSVFYQGAKREGDTILFAGQAPGVAGPAQGAFHDNTRVVLYVAQAEAFDGQPRWAQRPLRNLPRYNDRGLEAGATGESLWNVLGLPGADPDDHGRTLALDVPAYIGPPEARGVDADVRFRIVGYASYADLHEDWVRRDQHEGQAQNPLRVYDLSADLPPEAMPGLSAAIGREVRPGEALFRFTLMPNIPAHRVRANPQIAIEHLWHADNTRWSLLSTPLPAATTNALVIETASGERLVAPTRVGGAHETGGYRVVTKEIHPTPPFPIVTPGYEDATSAVVVVEITPPQGEPFERWVYDRFPELSQDFRGTQADGRPARTKADETNITVRYLDTSRLAVFIDERADGTTRAIVRQPGGDVRTIDDLASEDHRGIIEDVIPGIDLTRSLAWDHAARLERPVPTPETERDPQRVGTHDKAAIAVEVWSDAQPEGTPREVVWVPFTKYLDVVGPNVRVVPVFGGREVSLAFGRMRYPFPGFGVRMLDFEMISYDHRGAPRDYQSLVRVEPPFAERFGPDARFSPYEHIIKLNAPLRAPFHWDPQRPWAANALRRLGAGINPNQYKLSQAGWDQQGWQESQTQLDAIRESGQPIPAGMPDRPWVSFTILHVGNNPGIHVIAFGGVLMALGIPWAFYVKPWLVRREREKIKAAHAGTPEGAQA